MLLYTLFLTPIYSILFVWDTHTHTHTHTHNSHKFRTASDKCTSPRNEAITRASTAQGWLWSLKVMTLETEMDSCTKSCPHWDASTWHMDEVTPAQLMRPSIGQINTSCTVGGLIYITSRLTLFPGPLHLGLPIFRDACGSLVYKTWKIKTWVVGSPPWDWSCVSTVIVCNPKWSICCCSSLHTENGTVAPPMCGPGCITGRWSVWRIASGRFNKYSY